MPIMNEESLIMPESSSFVFNFLQSKGDIKNDVHVYPRNLQQDPLNGPLNLSI